MSASQVSTSLYHPTLEYRHPLHYFPARLDGSPVDLEQVDDWGTWSSPSVRESGTWHDGWEMKSLRNLVEAGLGWKKIRDVSRYAHVPIYTVRMYRRLHGPIYFFYGTRPYEEFSSEGFYYNTKSEKLDFSSDPAFAGLTLNATKRVDADAAVARRQAPANVVGFRQNIGIAQHAAKRFFGLQSTRDIMFWGFAAQIRPRCRLNRRLFAGAIPDCLYAPSIDFRHPTSFRHYLMTGSPHDEGQHAGWGTWTSSPVEYEVPLPDGAGIGDPTKVAVDLTTVWTTVRHDPRLSWLPILYVKVFRHPFEDIWYLFGTRPIEEVSSEGVYYNVRTGEVIYAGPQTSPDSIFSSSGISHSNFSIPIRQNSSRLPTHQLISPATAAKREILPGVQDIDFRTNLLLALEAVRHVYSVPPSTEIYYSTFTAQVRAGCQGRVQMTASIISTCLYNPVLFFRDPRVRSSSAYITGSPSKPTDAKDWGTWDQQPHAAGGKWDQDHGTTSRTMILEDVPSIWKQIRQRRDLPQLSITYVRLYFRHGDVMYLFGTRSYESKSPDGYYYNVRTNELRYLVEEVAVGDRNATLSDVQPDFDLWPLEPASQNSSAVLTPVNVTDSAVGIFRATQTAETYRDETA